MKTSHLNIKLIYSHQAQKEILINEALIKIDSLLNSGVISMNIATPPDSPENGDKYIVGADPKGIWLNHQGQISYYYNNWYFIIPKTGSLTWVNDQKKIFFYDQGKWHKYQAQ